MPKLSKRAPRKKNDINYFRAILKAICEKASLDAIGLGLQEELFCAYIKVLMDNKIVLNYRKSNPDNTLNYIISNPEEYEKWTKGNLYKKVEKYIMPLMPSSLISVNINAI